MLLNRTSELKHARTCSEFVETVQLETVRMASISRFAVQIVATNRASKVVPNVFFNPKLVVVLWRKCLYAIEVELLVPRGRAWHGCFGRLVEQGESLNL